MTPKKKGIFRKLLGYFLQGLLYIVPLAITIYVIYKIFNVIDDLIPDFLPVHIPGLGFLLMVIIITIIGFLGTTIIAQPIISRFKKLLDRAPLIKTIYSAITDLLSAFVGSKKTFNQPVLVKLSKDSELEKPGFVTKHDLSELGVSPGKVAVYLPHSYNFSGNLFIVPKENVTPINAPSAEVMKFIVSGGVTKFEKE